MKPELVIIDSIEGIQQLQEYLRPFEYIAFDTETTGLSQRDQVIGFSVCAEEIKAFYVILAEWKGQLVWNPLATQSIELFKSLQGKSLIMHNGVFDCKMIESNFKISLINSLHTDTKVLAHLLDENRPSGLKELSAILYGESSRDEQAEMKASVLSNGGVLTKDSYEMYKCDSQIMAKYGAKDAWLTYRLFMDLLPELDAQGLYDFFYNDECMPLLRGPTYQLNTTGLQVDISKLIYLKNTLKAECAEAKSFIYQEISSYILHKYPDPSKFNIGSNQQLSWLLFGQLKLEFGTLTKGGKSVCKSLGLRLPYTRSAKNDFIYVCANSVGEVYEPEAIVNGKKKPAKKFKEPWSYIAVDKSVLKKIAHKYKWIERLLEYQSKMKLLNTYVKAIEAKVQYGVLHPDYLQTGTVTGRYSSRNPNLQNLPRDDQRVKECFVARPGKVFVSADFSQLEPRMFASYSQDPKLLAAFDGTSDFYSVIGREVYEKYDSTPQKDGSPEAFGIKYKKLRDLSKVIALASAYGATPNQLAPTTGKTIEETSEDMNKYFERFPGVQKMMLEAHEIAKKTGQVTNLFGRVRRIPEAKRITKLYGNIKHWDLPYDARKLLNMACNFRIQSTGASIVNRAAIAFYQFSQQAGIECQLVSQCHDELVIECFEKDANEVALLLQSCMETTTILPGVALEAVPRTTRTLAK
jgi:DNA polymerase I-like protein with 3'-5' exonuclease and polymerase domains